MERDIQRLVQEACAERLDNLFKTGELYADSVADIAIALRALSSRQTSRNSGVYLQQLVDEASKRIKSHADPDKPIKLSHEQRVSVYVAAKILHRG